MPVTPRQTRHVLISIGDALPQSSIFENISSPVIVAFSVFSVSLAEHMSHIYPCLSAQR